MGILDMTIQQERQREEPHPGEQTAKCKACGKRIRVQEWKKGEEREYCLRDYGRRLLIRELGRDPDSGEIVCQR